MAIAETTAAHSRRIVRVIDHMAAHLDADLDLMVLAEVACFSPCHFHRIYRAAMGETPAETLRRLRLHRASVDLARDGLPMPDVARRAGFGSVAAFTRAFAAFAGQPPAAFREARRVPVDPAGGCPHPILEASAMTSATHPYTVTIEASPAIRLAVLPHRGDYTAIGAVFDRLYAWAAPRGLVGPGARAIGIYHDDPAQVAREDLRSHAGVTVPEGTEAPEGGEIRIIPALRVASLIHEGPYLELERAYAWLYGPWLCGSGEEPADHPCFEEYLNNPREVPPAQWLTRVCLPLKG
jgi:AraC family transcriptional regulator